MRINGAIILSYLFAIAISPALAQSVAIEGSGLAPHQTRVQSVQTLVLPARVVQIVVLPSALSDARDIEEGRRDQYYSEDTFDTMLVGF